MERLLVWKSCFAQLFAGAAGVLTFGYKTPNWPVKSAKKLAYYRHQKMRKNGYKD